jgi:allophanate hydrolase subunit 2
VFSVSASSDRTALRFEGPALARSAGDIATVGVLPGALQLPPDGLPILLLANCQSTGGYPVVAVVCSADLRLAAQARPGTVVRLQSISVRRARELAAQAAL